LSSIIIFGCLSDGQLPVSQPSGLALKIINGNGRSKTVREVTQVMLEEPAFGLAPDLPVSTKRFNEKYQR